MKWKGIKLPTEYQLLLVLYRQNYNAMNGANNLMCGHRQGTFQSSNRPKLFYGCAINIRYDYFCDLQHKSCLITPLMCDPGAWWGWLCGWSPPVCAQCEVCSLSLHCWHFSWHPPSSVEVSAHLFLLFSAHQKHSVESGSNGLWLGITVYLVLWLADWY